MSKTVVAIFDNYSSAENAARQIKDQGLRTDDISIIAKDENSQGDTATTGKNTGFSMGTSPRGVNDNISDGVMTGGILGGLAGLLIGAGSMVIPGLGIIAAAGPITGLLSGAVTGGIVGGLVDLGIPENKSRQYETDIKAGKILFSMKTDEDKVNPIGSILRNNGAVSVDSY
ncbi:MAG: Heat induced stress protein YflT [Firmicutes bacterium ADurb.Bin419]|nr:MAG: Heat induced stress protein YflT [Firmicutes bacterium ADurb.Bin419]